MEAVQEIILPGRKNGPSSPPSSVQAVAILHQHDIHIFNDRLEDFGKDTRTMQSERPDIN